jgi:S1-C subfamily serine protease
VEDLTIDFLDPRSPIFTAGFRTGDRLRSLNGSPVETLSRALNLIHEIRACDSITVQVQRGNEILDYRFDFK